MSRVGLVFLLVVLCGCAVQATSNLKRKAHHQRALQRQSLAARAQTLFQSVWPERESLMSWTARDFSFSEQHKDVLRDGVRYVSPAMLDTQRQFMLHGVDTADLDLSSHRFAELDAVQQHLSEAQRSQLQTRVAAQMRRRAWAKGRHAATVGISQARCNIMKAEIKRYKEANNAFPTADQAWVQINTDNAGRPDKPTKSEAAAMHAIVSYRLAYVGWAAACTDAVALATDALALDILAHPPAAPIKEFYMGLEEELILTSVSPDPDGITLAKSDLGAEPRLVPHLKVVGDHDDGAIIELATGPVPITEAGRTEHRLVVNTWDAQLPAMGQAAKKTNAINDAFNLQLADGNVAKPPLKYQLKNYKKVSGVHPDVTRRVHPDGDTKNNIQVNFEASLCAYYKYKRFFELTEDSDSQALDMAAFTAATNYVDGGLPGVTKPEIDNLPAQQQCELKGLYTLWVSHSMWNAVNDKLTEYKKAWKKIPRKDRPEYLQIGHWGTSTAKNFFNVMVKTPVHTIIPYLPFPLSDVVHRTRAAYDALDGPGKKAEDKKLHDLLIAELNKSPDESWAKKYTGKVPLTDRHYFTRTYAWLSDYRGAFRNYVAEGIPKADADDDDSGRALPCSAPIPCDRAPGVEMWVKDGTTEMQLVLVCEARFQYDKLNRAMNEGAKKTRSKGYISQIANLAKAVTYYRAGGATAKDPVWPIV